MAMRSRLLRDTGVALACLAGASLGTAVPPGMAVVTVESPVSLAGVYQGFFSQSSLLPPPEGAISTYVPPGDGSGCAAYEAPQAAATLAVVPLSGNCSLLQKVGNAQAAGLVGLMVVSDSASINLADFNQNATPGDGTLGIFTILVGQALGASLIEESAAQGSEPVQISLKVYKQIFPLLDPSVLCLVALAVSLVAVGAWFHTAAQRHDSPLAPQGAEEVLEIQWWLPAFWVVGASCALVVLYFLMRWLIYIVLLVFGLGGVGTVTQIGQAGLGYKFPALKKKVAGLEIAQLIAGTVGVVNSLSWFFLRHGRYAWPFQNVIGICFLCFFQRSIHMPNIKLAASLLGLMFLFDIFWVFVSPLFFSSSVMVSVAMGGGSGEIAPMLLRIPAFNDPLGSDRMLGYGDIAIPGLLVSMVRRFDILHDRRWNTGYYTPALIGYGVGLCCALVGLYLMQMGQPALLYLVPGTLGTSAVLSWRRGEFKKLWSWDGTPDASAAPLQAKFCAKGHVLYSQRATEGGERPLFPGSCDGCGCPTVKDAMVMNCSICNWYLCTSCRPQTAEEAPGSAPAAAQS